MIVYDTESINQIVLKIIDREQNIKMNIKQFHEQIRVNDDYH